MAVAIIAKDASKTIGNCLDSIVPYVQEVLVCVDATTTDNTAQLAKKHGARVVTGFQVQEEHTCPEHGTINVPHFAHARQRSFDLLSKQVDFYMWVDADDIVHGAEKLKEAFDKLDPNCAGLWLPYHYSKAGDSPDSPTATLFDRERIVRTSIPWKWMYRVHEILVPVDNQGNVLPTESFHWTRTDDISIVHQGAGHNTENSAHRNITLLEIDLEENPQDMRALFYLGNQYFALNRFHEAADCYMQATQAKNPYQVWQTWIYLSMACEKLGDMVGATQAAYSAIDIAPYHPEPYYRLAAMAMLKGDSERCEFWTREGDRKHDPPFFAFRNPLDRTYNSKITLGNAYANSGDVSKAKREFQLAYQVVKSDAIKEGIDNMAKLEEEGRLAESFVHVISHLDGYGNGHEASTNDQFRSIPKEVWKFGRVRDIIVPKMLKNRPCTQPRLVIWCGQSMEPWSPESLNTTGIGGSETAVIEIAKRFSRDGYLVDIYNNPDYLEGEYNQVGYWALTRWLEGQAIDILVSWRNPTLPLDMFQAIKNVLWCHDLNRGPDDNNHHAKWDIVLGVSQWHANYLKRLYSLTNVSWVPNGINLERFAGQMKKVPFKCCYTSSPDRGLDRLLQIWPDIIASEPTAELHIAYGWQNIDRAIQLGDTRLIEFRRRIEKLLEKSINVTWLGRMDQAKLAELYQECSLWLYPTSFLEVSCISAIEAMAAGCIPVTSSAGALAETIASAGIVVTGNTYTQAWKEYWLQCTKAALLSPHVRQPLSQAGPIRARELTWDGAYEKWKQILTGTATEAKSGEEPIKVGIACQV